MKVSRILLLRSAVALPHIADGMPAKPARLLSCAS